MNEKIWLPECGLNIRGDDLCKWYRDLALSSCTGGNLALDPGWDEVSLFAGGGV